MANHLGITNRYIDDLLNGLGLSLYRGVYSADTIPSHVLDCTNNCTCIVNTSKKGEKGMHFITLYVNKNTITIFDSLSLELGLVSTSLANSLSKSKKRIKYALKYPTQNISSAMCGFYCCFYVLMFENERFPIRSGVKDSTYNEGDKNDDTVVENICALIKNNNTRREKSK